MNIRSLWIALATGLFLLTRSSSEGQAKPFVPRPSDLLPDQMDFGWRAVRPFVPNRTGVLPGWQERTISPTPGPSFEGDEITFYRNFAPVANFAALYYPIHAATNLAQAALESSWGDSNLALNNKNYHGAKLSSRTTPADVTTRIRGIYQRTGYPMQPYIGRSTQTREEYTPGVHTWEDAVFKAYGAPLDSFLDYAVRSTPTSGRYSAVAGYTNPFLQLAIIWTDGYASSSRYFRTGSSLIEKFTGQQPPPGLYALMEEASTVDYASDARRQYVQRVLQQFPQSRW